MIEQQIQDSWKDAIRENFKETGLVGHFNVLKSTKNIDHNLIKESSKKQTKAIFREIFAEQLEMTRVLMKEIRDALCSEMEEGSVRDSFSNYEFSPDDIDELFKELLRDE